jgi:hypothetical protein
MNPRSHMAAIGTRLDEVASGAWWWRACRLIAERRLERALEKFGDRSIVVRRETERYRRLQFAVTYWRLAPAPVRQVVLEARRTGVNMSDLRLIVVNGDLKVVNGSVVLQRSILMRAASAPQATVVAIHFTLMCTLVVLLPGPLWLKVLAIGSILLVYGSLYRAWSLYAYRPLMAVRRVGARIDLICLRATIDNAVRVKKLGAP